MRQTSPRPPDLPPVPASYRVLAAIVRPPMVAWTRRLWRGLENIPPSGGVIVAFNHVSNIDALTMGHFLYNIGRPAKILAKHSLFRIPVVGWMLRHTGQIPVYRGTARSQDALRDAVAALERGECVSIFPEGTLTHDPQQWPMTARPGAVQLALATGVPLVPVAEWGTHALLPRHSIRIRCIPRKLIEIVAGPPLDLDDLRGWPDQRAAAIEGTKRLMGRLTAMVADLRGATPPDQPYDQFAQPKEPA